MIHALNYFLFLLAGLTGAPQDCSVDGDMYQVCAAATVSEAPAPPPPPENTDDLRVRKVAPIAISNGF